VTSRQQFNVATAHGSLDLKQEIQIQIQTAQIAPYQAN
jgi:hypothetical protein